MQGVQKRKTNGTVWVCFEAKLTCSKSLLLLLLFTFIFLNKLYNFARISFITSGNCVAATKFSGVFSSLNSHLGGWLRFCECLCASFYHHISQANTHRDTQTRTFEYYIFGKRTAVFANPGCKNFRPHKPWQIAEKTERQHHPKNWTNGGPRCSMKRWKQQQMLWLARKWVREREKERRIESTL